MVKPCFKIRWEILLAVALLFAIAISGCSKNDPNSFQGYVEGDFIYVSSSQSGRLDRLFVQRGEQVTANSPLFILESENEQAGQRQASEQVASSEATLEDMMTGKRAQEIDVIKSQLSQALAYEKLSQINLKRDSSLYMKGVIPKAQLDSTRATADSDSGKVRELKHQLQVAELAARNEQIKAQSANVGAAKATLDQAKWKVNQKRVVSNVSGLVFDTIYRVGEWVGAGMPVVNILPPENIKVRFFVPEPALSKIAIGNEVTIRSDNNRSDIPAKVTYISTQAEYTPPVIYSNETRSKLVYMIEAHPITVSTATQLHPGQPVVVRLK
ncbi:MAG: HlyD family efflux transporter periplasmic adaptor subunit [Desulfuromonadales bacterium]|nr:HlyD family efflux transporter periplasmic adaptor subunit [Desulfuromonadales bacterium]